MQAKRVMIIEDDDETRDLLTEVLIEAGYAVTAAATALDALAATVQGPPDVVIVDLRLPMMDGATFIREHLQELGSHPRVIVVSASAEIESFAARADAVMAKPFSIDELTSLVARVLEGDGQLEHSRP